MDREQYQMRRDIWDKVESHMATEAGRAYAAQLDKMLANGRAWMEQHPPLQIIVQYNFPRNVFIVSPISDAIKNHVVSCNDAGLDLIKALCPWGNSDEPTVAMVRAVLENLVEEGA